eukprot:Hpha_TRINITY_DN13069_c0_g1::TRINITY_DN13069_c0_g1_i1::g.69012::m.69012
MVLQGGSATEHFALSRFTLGGGKANMQAGFPGFQQGFNPGLPAVHQPERFQVPVPLRHERDRWRDALDDQAARVCDRRSRRPVSRQPLVKVQGFLEEQAAAVRDVFSHGLVQSWGMGSEMWLLFKDEEATQRALVMNENQVVQGGMVHVSIEESPRPFEGLPQRKSSSEAAQPPARAVLDDGQSPLASGSTINHIPSNPKVMLGRLYDVLSKGRRKLPEKRDMLVGLDPSTVGKVTSKWAVPLPRLDEPSAKRPRTG